MNSERFERPPSVDLFLPPVVERRRDELVEAGEYNTRCEIIHEALWFMRNSGMTRAERRTELEAEIQEALELGPGDYLQRASPATAARWYDQTAATFDFLARQPEISPLRATHDPALHGIRMWSVSGFERHLVFYRPLPDGIEVLFESTSPVGRRGIPPRAVAVR